MNVISFTQLVIKENGKQIQKVMNFAIQKTYSVVLMSTQKMRPTMIKFLMMEISFWKRQVNFFPGEGDSEDLASVAAEWVFINGKCQIASVMTWSLELA